MSAPACLANILLRPVMCECGHLLHMSIIWLPPFYRGNAMGITGMCVLHAIKTQFLEITLTDLILMAHFPTPSNQHEGGVEDIAEGQEGNSLAGHENEPLGSQLAVDKLQADNRDKTHSQDDFVDHIPGPHAELRPPLKEGPFCF